MSGHDAGLEQQLSLELVRQAERVADRLRVIGPRMAARDSAQAGQVLDDVQAVLQRLADVGADAAGGPRRPVPVLAPHALGDQVLVLAHEVAAVAEAPALRQALDQLLELKRRI